MADFDGPIGIADVRNAHPAAEPSGEDQVFALETVCIVLVKIMRSETDRTLVKALPRRVLRGLGLGKRLPMITGWRSSRISITQIRLSPLRSRPSGEYSQSAISRPRPGSGNAVCA